MSDYKYDIQLMAEQLALEKFNKEYYDLTDEQQYELFLESELSYRERQFSGF